MKPAAPSPEASAPQPESPGVPEIPETQPETPGTKPETAAQPDPSPGQEPAIPPLASDWVKSPWFPCSAGDLPAGTTVVTAFQEADHYFQPEDRRTLEALVTFPETDAFQAIGLRIELGCPADGDCDNWDRFANVTLVENQGTADEQTLELGRYITPYNLGMCIHADVTRFAPELRGQKLIRSFIDTWVGPNTARDGHGWRVTLKFVFHPGVPAKGALARKLLPLWPLSEVVVGDPARPVGAQLAQRKIPIPTDVTRAEILLTATGHGQGNTLNCGEFCRLVQEIRVNGQPNRQELWRSGCSTNPLGPAQAGNWKYSRANWCPGAFVEPRVVDVTAQIKPGEENVFEYLIQRPGQVDYVNACRPGAGDANNLCAGCQFNPSPGNCDYDGGNHTQPHDKISAQLLLY